MIGDAQEEAGEQGKQLAILAAGLVELRAAAPPVGLGRIVALYHHPATLYQIRE
jgi:hypothetical protein